MPNAVPGGAERATMLMLGAHDRQRYEPGVLFFSEGPLVDAARRLGVDVRVLDKPLHLRHPWSIQRTVAAAASLVGSGEYHLVHSCMAYAHLIGGAVGWRCGVPAVLYQHGPLGLWMDGAATLLRCDRILVNSTFTAEGQLAQSWRSRPITTAPYGIDMTCPTDRERDEWRALIDARHAVPPNAPVVGIMARFDPWKGIDVALQATAPLLRSDPDCRFLVVGGQYRHFHPGYGEALAALAEREGVGNQVVFAGFQMDVRPYLARMTVLVHASVQPEPFGLTIIEAMAAGVPVVAARAGGAAEIVDEGIDGLLHTPGNQTELRDALHTLLSDATVRDRYVRAGLRKVESRYRPASMMRVIEGVYDELLGVGVSASNRESQPVVQAS